MNMKMVPFGYFGSLLVSKAGGWSKMTVWVATVWFAMVWIVTVRIATVRIATVQIVTVQIASVWTAAVWIISFYFYGLISFRTTLKLNCHQSCLCERVSIALKFPILSLSVFHYTI